MILRKIGWVAGARVSIFAGAMVAAIIPAQAASIVQRVGPEFAANTLTQYWQLEPTVAALSNGGFVVAWQDDSKTAPDTFGAAVRARLFNRAGKALGKESLVNRWTDYDQTQAQAVALRSGGFVIAWTDWGVVGGDSSSPSVHAQRFNNSGARQGSQFLVNKVTRWSQYHPSITPLKNGGFAVAYEDWSETAGDDSPSAVRAQAFRGNGGRSGADFRANSTTALAQTRPAIAGLSDGKIVVVWADASQTKGDSTPQIVARRFTGSGGPAGGEVVVNRTSAGYQENPAVAALGKGKYVVVWEESQAASGDTDGYAIRGQIMGGAGKRIGPEFIVPTRRSDDQRLPVVASFPNGRFIVAWTDSSAEGGDQSGTAVRAQIFSPTGKKLGSEIQINRGTANDQKDPAVAIFNNRTFVVVWSDWSGGRADRNPSGIKGQIFRLTR